MFEDVKKLVTIEKLHLLTGFELCLAFFVFALSNDSMKDTIMNYV